jgi:hypothetical protein
MYVLLGECGFDDSCHNPVARVLCCLRRSKIRYTVVILFVCIECLLARSVTLPYDVVFMLLNDMILNKMREILL